MPTTFCAFCENEATKEVRHHRQVDPPLGKTNLDFITPICSHCAEIYECGQASPNAEVVDPTEE